jgi:hypothetical protein
MADMPREVRRVYKMLVANRWEADQEYYNEFGRKFGYEPPTREGSEDMCSAYYKSSTDEWFVGSSCEDGSGSYIYKDGTWKYRSAGTGEDSPASFEVAMSDASIWFTG